MADVPLITEWENLDEAFEQLELECAEVVRGMSIEAWQFVLNQTPQYYGRLAASWTYSVGQPRFVDRSAAAMLNTEMPADFITDPDEGDVFSGRRKGDEAAIGIANFASAGNEMSFTLGATIFFSNGANHGEGPYAADVESGSIRLRAVNQPGKMASRALDMLAARYGNQVSAGKAGTLRLMRIR